MEERKSRYELFLEEEAREAQPQTKRCSKCKASKAPSEYHKNKYNSDGLHSECKSCRNEARRKYKSREDRFWKFYWSHTKDVGECREWDGQYVDSRPVCSWNGKKNASVRRIMYRLTCGELADDMIITMTCRNKRCVRHSHLSKITKDEFEAIRCNSAASGDQSGARLHPESIVRGEKHWKWKQHEAAQR